MPAFHLLRCLVDIGGDKSTDVYRDRTRPIVFPELPILQFIHGEEAVTEVYVVGQWETTNDEVLQRLANTYPPETIQAVFPGARPRLPISDPSIPRCTMPVYKPRSPRPANPDPRLKPLDQFTMTPEMPVLEAPPLPVEDDPTPDEIAAHAQDDDDDPTMPRPEDLPHMVRDTSGHGSSRRASAERVPSHLPDVNAGGSHAPGFVDTSQGYRSHAPSAAQEAKRRG
jgi:hypothetical protein